MPRNKFLTSRDLFTVLTINNETNMQIGARDTQICILRMFGGAICQDSAPIRE